jgi:UDP-N-acetylglucosamine--N-acetylmuramyl-(pentapeptide) pyrophosphoryl-undecaprenol N-acetylglucosamine transferase
MKNKILIAGGHAGSTAYALIQKIRRLTPAWEIVFVGSASAIEGGKVQTLENTYFPKLGVRYIKIIMGRIQTKLTFWTIPSIVKIPLGLIQALYIVYKERPRVVVSFGGFSAFPIVLASKIFGISVVIHEQTSTAGRTNLLSGYFADKIALSRKESLKYFSNSKSVVIGNPISEEVSSCRNKKYEKMKNAILVAGGSRGSKIINENIKKILPELVTKFIVYHQTGSLNYSEFKKIRSSLSEAHQKNYHPFPLVEMWNWYKYLQRSDFVISRSGANIVSETLCLTMPSIFIPLSISYNNEQYHNALQAQKLGLAEIILEEELSPEILFNKITYTSKNWRKIINNAKKPEIDDRMASEKLLGIILKYA